MQALQLTGWKSPPELREVPDPEPGPGQVVVRVAAAGACHSDLHLMHDFEPGLLPYDLPFTLGHENTGIVEAVGSGVQHLEPGEPVAVYGPWGCGRCWRCHQGMENYCERAVELGGAGGGLGFDGGMAPLMLVPQARWLVPLGDLDPVAAAPLTDAGLTPYHAIKRSRHLLHPGSTAVVIGVGGLGHLAIQILKATSAASVVAVDTRPEALDLARSVGADHTVASGDDAAAQVRDLTGGKGADVALDFVGVDATIALAAQVSRPLAHVTVVGIGGGSFPFGFFSLPYEVSLATTYWGTLPELAEVLDLARRGLVTAHVERFGLADAPRAYEALAAGELRGRAVIVP
ncbi:MAG TPA: NAD(P)-dependent alcohol dehydrogenase [Acidimicrobiales bacterium]